MSTDFPLALADATDYPAPTILATADKHNISLLGLGSARYSQFIAQGMYVKNGRSAIAHVAKTIGLQPGDTILLPEYFCPAMVEPFLWMKLKVKFYRLDKTLHVDQAYFKSLIDANVKACLFVRFFGFVGDIEESLILAKSLGLLAIEDCAHSYFSQEVSVKGECFDASICSLNKFFPCVDGGMYRLSNKYSANDNAGERGISHVEELKNTLHFIGLEKGIEFLKKLIKPSRNNSLDVTKSSDEISAKSVYRYFKEQDLGLGCFRLTKWIVGSSNNKKIIEKRRQNYTSLYAGLISSSLGQPLFKLKPNAVPYVFPFLLHDDDDFDYIREQGIQILRWEEFTPSDNKDVETLRERLIQIPCHQNLTFIELQKIITIINKR